MLSKKQRLEKSSFSFVFRHGEVKKTDNFLVKMAELSDGTAGCAAVVSKKTAKNAVVRNRIRRKVYSALRECFSTKAKKSFIFIVTKDISLVPVAKLASEVSGVIKLFLERG